MKTFTSTIKTIFVTSLVLFFGIGASVYASTFEQVPFEFEDYNDITLYWVDSADDAFTGSTALGFSVTIGGATYSYFDMSSDGYIELLTDAGDVPTGYGWGYISGLTSFDSSATYLLAAYDDLTSSYYGYYGYKLLPDRAVFYYDTETVCDGDYALLNNFEVVLYNDGKVQWNFNYADYECFGYDLFSGLYFGNTQTLLTLTNYIPEQKSYLYYGCADWLTADFNQDCFVDWVDFSIFAQQWLKCGDLDDPNCQP
jgi:hypothetical protein